MEKHKLDKISSLKDEVRDFHPVLKALFGRLPAIVSVEYRQGPNEMGADFVLTKKDETLGSQDYIGVIVKTGNIKQDHQDIDRQINECEMPRMIEGGKKNIILNEIWVVSNDTITANAQSLIHHKYSNKNIKFLSGEKVCALIDKYFPQFWSDVSVKIGEYLREVEAKSNNMTFGTSQIATKAIANIGQNFIKVQSVGKSFRQQRKKDIKQDLRLLSSEHQFLFIEGMMGMGKSTALGQLTRDLSTAEAFNAHGVLPILLSMKEASSEFAGDITTIVTKVRDRLDASSHNVKFVVMLDALDELDITPEERVKLVDRVHSSAQETGCQLIVTSRSLSDPVLEKEIEKRFQRYEITQLTVAQIITLVDHVCKNAFITQKLRKDLEKSRLFRSLPRTPISAILLARILEENAQEIPSTMTELYSKYMELVLGRWDMSKSLQTQMEYDVISNVSVQIAKFLIDNSLDRIALSEVKDMCSDYIKGRNLKVECDFVVSKMLAKRELFFVSPIDGTVSFNHRTFAEYLYASGLIREGDASITEKSYDPYWITTYFFLFGLRRDAPELIKQLDSIKLDEEIAKLFKISHHAGFLLAAYLTPYSIIQASIRKAIQEAAELYSSVLSERQGLLADFSELQLLSIITHALTSAYGYEYFHPALLEISTDLYSDPKLESKMVEFFFVNSALSSISDGKAFDTMIKDYGPQIPLSLQIGIVGQKHEAKGNSDILDKYIKNFYKKGKGNPGMHEGMKRLLDDPINKKKELKVISVKKGATKPSS